MSLQLTYYGPFPKMADTILLLLIRTRIKMIVSLLFILWYQYQTLLYFRWSFSSVHFRIPWESHSELWAQLQALWNTKIYKYLTINIIVKFGVHEFHVNVCFIRYFVFEKCITRHTNFIIHTSVRGQHMVIIFQCEKTAVSVVVYSAILLFSQHLHFIMSWR